MKQLPILLSVVAACVFAAGGTMAEDNTRNDAARAIDGDLDTVTHLTPARTTGWQTAVFDLGGARRVNRLRVAPIADVDGVGAAVDHLDLVILYTTDSGDPAKRRFLPVTNLGNGFKGGERVVAEAVSTNGAVSGVRHDYSDSGHYSLTFDAVNATAVGVQFSRGAGDDQPWNHFAVREVEAYNDGTKAEIAGVRVFSGKRALPSADDKDAPPLARSRQDSYARLRALPLGAITAEGWFSSATRPAWADTWTSSSRICSTSRSLPAITITGPPSARSRDGVESFPACTGMGWCNWRSR
ncbi:MAG: hypothetical protein NTV49_10180 [Kiritimatiellaeota bacterium]|nr:hypothetical protein [Kiritimatiellota bacterium]